MYFSTAYFKNNLFEVQELLLAWYKKHKCKEEKYFNDIQ
jgi:hypothetical protein